MTAKRSLFKKLGLTYSPELITIKLFLRFYKYFEYSKINYDFDFL